MLIYICSYVTNVEVSDFLIAVIKKFNLDANECLARTKSIMFLPGKLAINGFTKLIFGLY